MSERSSADNLARSMVDTNVLALAFRIIGPKDRPETREWHDASQQLLKRMPVIRVCAIAWMEFVRGLRPPEKEAERRLYGKIQVEVVDGAVSDRAVRLLAARNLREGLCPHCRNALKATPCPRCHRLISSKQNLNDAIVVATAEILEDVDVLYCYDDGIKDFEQHLAPGSCRLAQPPHPIGPLFAGK